MPNYKRIPVAERMLRKTNKTETCWLWTGWKDRTGYGQTSRPGRNGATVGAHRVAYELSHGAIPAGYEIDHICHTRACVNPDHLRLATPKQNKENQPRDRANNTSGVRGVSWCAERKKWQARVQHHKKMIHVGRYDRIEDAAAAVKAKRIELFTHSIEDDDD